MLSRKNLLALLGAFTLCLPTTKQAYTSVGSEPSWPTSGDINVAKSRISDTDLTTSISSIVVYKGTDSAVTPASSTYVTGIKFNM